jgi:hypothetical protein
MPRTCTICRHKKRDDIDKALVDRRPFRSIAEQHGVSATSLIRHHDDHLPAKLVRAKRAAEAVEADALLDQVLDLRDKALGVLDSAEGEGDRRGSIAAIREARACIELLGKLAGQLASAPTINITLSAEWMTVQATVLAALQPHPEARIAVAAALEHHEAGHA